MKRRNGVTYTDMPAVVYLLDDDEVGADLAQLGIRVKRTVALPAYLKDDVLESP